jgi:hypothetical protein
MAQDVTRKFEVWINDKTQTAIYTRADVIKTRATKRCRSATELDATNCKTLRLRRENINLQFSKNSTLYQISFGGTSEIILVPSSELGTSDRKDFPLPLINRILSQTQVFFELNICGSVHHA